MASEKNKRTRFENFIRFLKFRVLHVNDSPKRIALGVAIGLFVAWAPILGIRMVVALFIAMIIKANKIVSMAVVWVCNPLTYVPMWSAGYIVGNLTLKMFMDTDGKQPADVTNRANSFSLAEFSSRFSDVAFWKETAGSLCMKGLELWVGSLIIGIIFAVVSYFITYPLIVRHRKKNPHRRFQTQQ